MAKSRDLRRLAASAPSPRLAEFRRRLPGQLVSFACVGVASTAAYALLYLGLRGVGVTAQVANATSNHVFDTSVSTSYLATDSPF
jgi:putative flippase GtrA